MEIRTASFVRRLLAGVADFLPFAALAAIAIWLAFFAPFARSLVLVGVVAGAAILYSLANFLLWPAFAGRTLGYRLLKLRVIPTDRVRERGIGIVPALTRLLAQCGLSPFFGLGFIWYFIDAKNRMWHDLVAATIVIPEAEPQPPPFVQPNFWRLAAGFVGGLAGTMLFVFVLATIVGAQIFYAVYVRDLPAASAASLDAGPGFEHLAKIPADFPEKVVITGEEYIKDVAVRKAADGKSAEVEVLWNNVPGETTSVLLAYKLGFEMLDLKTEIEYADAGPILHFSDKEASVSGTIRAAPTADGKATGVMFLDVNYLTGKK